MNKKSTFKDVVNNYLTHQKSTKGITLIALIVTIIVLIILAGISVNLLLGENGLLQRAKDGVVVQAKSEKKEAVALALQEEFIATRGVVSDITVEGLLKEIQRSQGSTAIYALKDVGGTEQRIEATEGNTSLGCKIVFPKEITGAAKTDIIVIVDEYGKTTSVITEDEENSNPPTPPTPPPTSYTITYNSNGGSGNMDPTTGETVEVAINDFTAPGGKKFKKWNTAPDESGTVYSPGDVLHENIELYAIWENRSYTQWTKVKIGNEKFYVLTKYDTVDATEIELFAKCNLSNEPETEGTFAGHYMQANNAVFGDTACKFSNKNYWGSETNLNNYTIPTTGADAETLATNALLKADDYAKALGGQNATGRLLDYETANSIIEGNKVNVKDKLWGIDNLQGNSSTERYLKFWLGTSYDSEQVYYINGKQQGMDSCVYTNMSDYRCSSCYKSS